MNEKKDFVIKRVKEHFDELIKLGYNSNNVAFIGLQGSQNYNLDIYEENYKSDVDTKAIIVPSLDDIVNNKTPIGKTIVLSNNEHIDVKDIRLMFGTFEKQNINFIEILFSKCFLISENYKEDIKELLDNNEKIAHLNKNQAVRAMAGMSLEKLKALEHPYPSIINKINEFGYDPKQLHHIIRIFDFLNKYIAGVPYKECIIPTNIEYLKDIKRGILSLEEARITAKSYCSYIQKIKNDYIVDKDIIDKDAIQLLNKIKTNIIKKKLKNEIMEDQ